MQHKSTVLIIEDDHAAASSIAALCRQLGLRALIAHDGATGLRLAAVKRPRLVLSDLGVPGLDGFEVARRIRGNHMLDGTAVIAVTDHAPKTPASNQVTFDDYVLKPVSPDTIQNLLSKYCSLS